MKTLVRGGRCEADWVDPRGEPRCSLEDRSCQGMVPTTVSSAWPQDGSGRSVASSRNAHCTRAALRLRDTDQDQTKTNRPKALEPSAGEEITTRGLWQSRPSSKPLAASAIAPGPCRGWGRQPLAHIRAQREPVVPPAGTGTEYRRPEGSPDDSHDGASHRETPRDGRKGHRSAEWRQVRFLEGNDLLVPLAVTGQAGRAHRCRRRRALGIPAVERDGCRAVMARQQGSRTSGRPGLSASLAQCRTLAR